MKDDPAIDENNKENLDIIQASGEHLLMLVNEVLDISRIEANQLSLREEIINLPALVMRLGRMFKLQTTEKNLSFRCTVDDRLPDYIWGDETKLLQVLINLLGNAIKFTHHGHVILRAWSTAEVPDQLYFEVEDTGIGISPAEIDKIFEPFVRGAVAGTQRAGSGLGLFISRQLVERMGGELSVHSQVHKGSKFKVSLPLRPAKAAAHQLHNQLPTPRDLDEEQLSYRILVVDDVAFNRKLLATILTDVGFSVREATDGETAISLWQQWQPQLIMMDIQMPVMDGYQVAQQIRDKEVQQALSPTPIIAVSGATTEEEQTAAFTAGFNGLLAKPFNRSQLLKSITDALIPSLD